MVNKLTVRDIAKTLHAYPSNGYLMYRISLALALSDIWGVFATCGSIPKILGYIGRPVQGTIFMLKHRKSSKMKKWEAIGIFSELSLKNGSIQISFIDAYKDRKICEEARHLLHDNTAELWERNVIRTFLRWLDTKPSRKFQ